MEQWTKTMSKDGLKMYSCSNDELDRAITKINLYYFASENNLVKNVMFKQLEVLAEEAVKRDNSLSHKIKQYLYNLKNRKKDEQRK